MNERLYLLLFVGYLICVLVAALAFPGGSLTAVYGIASWVGGVFFTLLVQGFRRERATSRG